MRASTFCLFGKDAKILLVQILLGSDYSGSGKELRFCQFASFESNLAHMSGDSQSVHMCP